MVRRLIILLLLISNVTVAQTLSAGTVLNVEGSSNKYTVKGSITINKFPQSNTTVFLDLDSILTLGTQSP